MGPKSKIRTHAKKSKLNKWIQRIGASLPTGVPFSVSRIELCVTPATHAKCPAFWGSQLKLASGKKLNTENTENAFEKRNPVLAVRELQPALSSFRTLRPLCPLW
jgi:hypothetical protein